MKNFLKKVKEEPNIEKKKNFIFKFFNKYIRKGHF